MGIQLTSDMLVKLEMFVELLRKWNHVHNLTSIIEEDKIITHHILDSLSVYPYISGNLCADLGSGGGLPGAVLAILDPKKKWVLIESKQKKASFLREIKARLSLQNIDVFNDRVEAYDVKVKLDNLVVRAVADLDSIFKMTSHLQHSNLRIVAMKGSDPSEEVEMLKNNHQVTAEIYPVRVPGLLAKRHIVIL